MSTIISVENLSKSYRLGQINTGTVTYDFQLWWAKIRGKPSPWQSVLETDHGNQDGKILWALKDVSFRVEQGEVLGIIGRNGAGKSTLLKILSRVTAPTIGKVKIKGRIASLLEVGTGFHPDLTGRENVYLNGAILGMNRREIDRKFDEIVDFSEVEKFIDTPVKRYSSGMYVRLAFAVAAHLDPEILIIDEVLAVGDVEFQKKCLGKIGDVAKEGRTVLFVSHNMGAVSTLCKSAIVFTGGKKVFSGLAAESVSFYIQQSHSTEAHHTWDVDDDSVSNRYFRLRSLRVCNHAGQLASAIASDQPFELEVEYSNLIDGSRINVCTVLYSQAGVCVLSTINNHEEEWHGRPMPCGTYKSRCTFPANLFSPGSYYVSIILTREGYVDPIRLDEAIQLIIHEQGDLRGDYFGGWSGIIRPWLEWKTKMVKLGEGG